MDNADLKEALSLFKVDEEILEVLPSGDTFDSTIKMKVCHSPELDQAFSVLRFLIKNEELSQRGAILTQSLIEKVKNHYAAWIYRKQYLSFLNKSQEFELERNWCCELIQEDPKVFQSWDHLRFCTDKIGSIQYEQQISFLEKIYNHDTKNYHAWTYRVWLVNRFNLHAQDLDYIADLLKKDLSNNSIWSHRNFLAKHLKFSEEDEFEFSTNIIKSDSRNESAWFYLDDIYESKNQFSQNLDDFLENLISENKINRFVLKSKLFNEMRRKKEIQNRNLMISLVFDLETKYDKTRAIFWKGFHKLFFD